MTTKKQVSKIIIIITVIFLAIITTSCNKETETLKVAWMTTWTDGGLTAQALKNTDILEKNNANAEMISFLYGPPMVEAALSNQVDVLFVGWVPAVNLMSKSDDWIIVSKLAYFPMELMAREGSGIQSVNDLKNKKIGVPYATGPYPHVVNSLKEKGLIAGKDYELVNLKPSDMGTALERAYVDAVSWSEPSLTLFAQKKLAYPIEEYTDISFIVVSKSYAENHPEQMKNFLKAIKEAQFYVSQHKEEVFGWFAEESRFDLSLVKSLKIIEPNYDANSIEEVDLTISDFWIKETQKKIDFEYQEGILSKKLVLSKKIDQSYISD
ncbi:MAG: ABC transporter substrate-binding protein [Nanoarchaeota archaeon]|nr:ABC transporter substrate-binding protein [Nanoarchaeota archaeon]MBU1322255.1 ABC transporter substrate-binding protein [Nanoarchaeota archaeon]MBU1598235.1 ABC transporter substrate-binding protein [Nanoarchaeota archaeon]MBU2441988.1 ABC transporter substrate-binding protein [Nanoarchaeota archaeon]